MPGAFFLHLFGDAARDLQAEAGSRTSYARREASSPGERDELSATEVAFLAARDSVFLASVTADGWPYVQHRGGPPGFIRHIGENCIGFADYPGNRQYISLGNLLNGGRVALIAMDYAARRRLKLIGHARIVSAPVDPDMLEAALQGQVARHVERALVIDVVGFDWNCPQYIEPRFSRSEIASALAHEIEPLRAENERLRAELDNLRAKHA